MVSPLRVFVGLVLVLLLRRAVYEFTTGARRRRMIKEHGCQPAYHYPHKGILGRLFGLDIVQDRIKAGKEKKALQRGRERFFTDHHTAQFQIFRRRPIITIEPENVKTLLSASFEDFALGAERTSALTPVLGGGIFANNGAAWEHSRALVRPNFTRHQVADIEMYDLHVSHLIDAIPRDGSTIDLQELFFSLTMDSATEFLFGRSTHCLAPGLETHSAAEFVKAYTYVTQTMATEFKSGGFSRWLPDSKRRNGIKTIHKFADEIVAGAIERLKVSNDVEKNANQKAALSDKERYVFLYELLKQTRDAYTLRSELLNILLAGRDTTAGLLSNTWWVIARRPDIWSKLRAEVDALDGKKPSYADIKEMKYLRYVLNESLRLMPVVPSNSRTAIRDTVLPLGGGPDEKSPLFIAKGTTVIYIPWSLHRRKDFYGEDADEFKPERWETLRPGWEYLPFNGGPRICIGQQFALMEASYTTVKLMQVFQRIEPRDDREWSEEIRLTLATDGGTRVALFEK